MWKSWTVLAVALGLSMWQAGPVMAGSTCGARGQASVVATGNPGQQAATQGTIVQVAQQAGQFKTLVQAVQAAGLVDVLSGPGPFTVFAPTDEAFAALPKGTLESLLKPENRDRLRAILTYHVVPGRVTSKDLKAGPLKTVQGQLLTVNLMGQPQVDNARIIRTDIPASNGVIHVIDRVVLPK
ncbi:MAG: fasciclin domain-containing protein [Gloeomargarita sp. SKYG116]|nr:fasciclin domain-containing protein [Gloeomargarita sp. SKYG116]MDW8401422.1 fasciclin domain-containing protein [Gloeomargarita sp. SKYGB_i_bin116]